LGQQSTAARQRIAGQAVIIAAAILLAFIAIGQILLEALGVDLASFRIAGGLVLLVIALRMVLDEPRTAVTNHPARENVAIFPLAMPLIAGPGAILAVVLLTDNNVYTIWQQVETAALLLVVLALTYGCLVGAELTQRLLGPSSTTTTRSSRACRSPPTFSSISIPLWRRPADLRRFSRCAPQSPSEYCICLRI
jgi:multiple antibiotic resistance protein